MIKSRSVYWFDANSIISRDLITIVLTQHLLLTYCLWQSYYLAALVATTISSYKDTMSKWHN